MSKETDEIAAFMADLNISDEEWDSIPERVRKLLLAQKKMALVPARQHSINFDFLRKHIDYIHQNLCPGRIATWQDRAEQAAKASERLRWHDCKLDFPDTNVTVLLYVEQEGDKDKDGMIVEGFRLGDQWIMSDAKATFADHPVKWMHVPYPTKKPKEAA